VGLVIAVLSAGFAFGFLFSATAASPPRKERGETLADFSLCLRVYPV